MSIAHDILDPDVHVFHAHTKRSSTRDGIWIDQWILGIGEVWYFPSKTAVFTRNDGFTLLCDEQHCVFLRYLD